MEYFLALIVLLAAVAALVIIPIVQGPSVDRAEDERRGTLEAAKEAKYREIRDAELDHRMGKMSETDWRATDRELRAQAIEILREIDDLPADEEPPTVSDPAR